MSEMIASKQPREGVLVERAGNGTTYTPRFDIFETDKELLRFGDLPGVGPDDLEIRYENHELTVHGKVSPRENRGDLLYGEYGVGDFFRSFTVGDTIDSEKISAELQDGVVVIHLPKVAEVQPRKIPVKAS